MSETTSSKSFQLAKDLQLSDKSQSSNFRFCLSNNFDDIKSLKQWCNKLGDALDTDVEFVSQGTQTSIQQYPTIHWRYNNIIL